MLQRLMSLVDNTQIRSTQAHTCQTFALSLKTSSLPSSAPAMALVATAMVLTQAPISKQTQVHLQTRQRSQQPYQQAPVRQLHNLHFSRDHARKRTISCCSAMPWGALHARCLTMAAWSACCSTT